VTDLAAFADVDLVIEAATEDPSIKLDTFRTLDAIVRPEVVLGSNTSSIRSRRSARRPAVPTA
jgi:3-hydroxybutyryl-CoA dehydrogenase